MKKGEWKILGVIGLIYAFVIWYGWKNKNLAHMVLALTVLSVFFIVFIRRKNKNKSEVVSG